MTGDDNLKLSAIQSREWLINAFFDLLSIKPLNSITILEIAQKAELDRRTFYRHFKTKEDIINYYIHEAAKSYEDAMRENKFIDNRAIAQVFFEICLENKKNLKILYKQNLLHLLLSELNIIFTKYQKQFARQEELQMENREYFLAYNIGGFWNLLIKWLDDDCKKTPEQLAEIVEQIFLLRQI